MPSIQIKDVPSEVHRTLRMRAAQAGQSLQEYLLARLVEDASRPTLDELLRKVEERSGGRVTFDAAARALREDRERR